MRWQKAWLTLLALAALNFTGCAMYSETRDAQGKAAKEAWGKVDLEGQTSIARKNLIALYDQSLSAIENFGQLQQDFLVTGLALSYGRSAHAALVDMQAKLGVAPSEYPCAIASVDATKYCSFSNIARAWDDARLKERTALNQWKGLKNDIELVTDLTIPTCTAYASGAQSVAALIQKLQKEPKISKIVVDEKFGLGPICNSWAAAREEKKALVTKQSPNSLWLSAIAVDEAEQKKLSGLRAEALLASAEVREAMSDADSASTETGWESENSKLAKVQKTTAKLASTVTTLLNLAKHAPDNLFLKEVVLDAKLESLNAFFKSLKDAKPGEDPPAPTGKAAAAVILFSNYFDETGKALKRAQGYGVAGLVLERRLAEIEQERVKRKIAVQQQQVALTEAIAQLTEQQLDVYIDADITFSMLSDDSREAQVHTILVGNDSKVTPRDREFYYRSITAYIDSGPLISTAIEKLKAQSTSLMRMDAVTASETSLKSWSALIGTNVDQLAIWAASGIKSEHILQFINSLAAVYIAYGVNK